MHKFKQINVKVPKHDCDVIITLPGGKEITVQLRPSNADEGYNGSLDIILPEDHWVTNWKGDDMQPSKGHKNQVYTRYAKQLVTDLPGDYHK